MSRNKVFHLFITHLKTTTIRPFICMISFTLVNDERNVQKHVASSGSGDDGVAVDIDTVGLLQQAS